MSDRPTEHTREEMQRLVNAFQFDTRRFGEDITQDLYCLAEDVATVVLAQPCAGCAALREQAQLYIDQREMTLAAKRDADVRCAALREALAGVVGASAPDELERMARFIREDGLISDEDRAVTLNAIAALAQSQPDGEKP